MMRLSVVYPATRGTPAAGESTGEDGGGAPGMTRMTAAHRVWVLMMGWCGGAGRRCFDGGVQRGGALVAWCESWNPPTTGSG
jgi:hypothetical protein